MVTNEVFPFNIIVNALIFIFFLVHMLLHFRPVGGFLCCFLYPFDMTPLLVLGSTTTLKPGIRHFSKESGLLFVENGIFRVHYLSPSSAADQDKHSASLIN